MNSASPSQFFIVYGTAFAIAMGLLAIGIICAAVADRPSRRTPGVTSYETVNGRLVPIPVER